MNVASLNIQEVQSPPSGSAVDRFECASGEAEGSGSEEGLHLRSLRLTSFRNYRSFELKDIGDLTILIGPNAAGKTTVVEAVQMLTDLKSFRTARYGQMVHMGDDAAIVRGNLAGNGRDLDIRLTIRSGKRSYQLNGKNKAVQDLKGLLPAVTFSPDDLNLAKGSNTARRAAIDDLGSQLSKNFYTVRSDYAKLIKQKNRALKEDLPDAYIDSVDDLLVRVGSQLMAHRMVILDKMRPDFISLYREISDGVETLDFAYIPSWEKEDVDSVLERGGSLEDVTMNRRNFDKEEVARTFAHALVKQRERERAYGKSIVGPHADKVSFILDGRNQTHYSSQGQQRSIVLAFKLAEAAVIQDTLHQKPILLLDDVMSELDERRRQYFMQFISGDIQTFITTTNRDYFDDVLLSKAGVVELVREDRG